MILNSYIASGSWFNLKVVFSTNFMLAYTKFPNVNIFFSHLFSITVCRRKSKLKKDAFSKIYNIFGKRYSLATCTQPQNSPIEIIFLSHKMMVKMGGENSM